MPVTPASDHLPVVVDPSQGTGKNHLVDSMCRAAVAAVQRDVLTFLIRLFVPQIIFYGLAAITAGRSAGGR